MAPAATLPPGPFFTAVTGASAVVGMTVRPASRALGTVTAAVVAKAILLAVAICVPDGIVTALPVLALVNVTVPVAGVSTTFWPVALKVPLAWIGNSCATPGTVIVESLAVLISGSTLTVTLSGPTGSDFTVRTTVALGSSTQAPMPPTTSRAANARASNR